MVLYLGKLTTTTVDCYVAECVLSRWIRCRFDQKADPLKLYLLGLLC